MGTITPLRKILSSRKQNDINYNDLRDRGSYFENIVVHYFKQDAKYKNRFKNVWLWSNFPYKTTSDSGIDIVAEEEDGTYCAIQCKWYNEEKGVITKDDIDSFLSASGKVNYSSRIIVSTTDKWSKQAENAIQDQLIKVTRIGINNLEESNIDWEDYLNTGKISYKKESKKELREYQKEAIAAVKKGFETADRGKLIMACGTGKTFTSLKIMEELQSSGSIVLFLVPSLALVSQTHKEWSEQSNIKLKQFAICSDSSIGKDEDYKLTDLEIPATTDSKKVANKTIPKDDEITVIYLTYHSIEVIHTAQKKHGLREIDLIICDEAHRTTGAQDALFTKVHDKDYIIAKKRLYMTATPRIFSDNVKQKAKDRSIVIYSMDDKAKYGEEFYKISFKTAVEQKLLTDYKVLVLVIDDSYINSYAQELLSENGTELKVDDAAKIIGCWNGLSKNIVEFSPNDKVIKNVDTAEQDNSYKKPMQRALAFVNSIKASELIEQNFKEVIHHYKKRTSNTSVLNCEIKHVDGKQNSITRKERLAWLKDKYINKDECRILINVKCLSEGVDVPALDAVIFLQPRNSQIDIIQAVGRVMRRAPGKELGYVIIPIVVRNGVSPEAALNNNEDYQTLWQLINALIAHDDRMDAYINSINITKDHEIEIKHDLIGIGGIKEDTQKPNSLDTNDNQSDNFNDKEGNNSSELKQYYLPLYDKVKLKEHMFALLAKKCGSRNYWPNWAADVALTAQSNINRITSIIEQSSEIAQEFYKFLDALQSSVNPCITKAEVIEMLAQHMVTKPVFNALFKDNNFSDNNPISKDMEEIVKLLEKCNIDSENKSLQALYTSVAQRAETVKNSPEGQQRLIIELYDNFFRKAFPKMAQRLGIVYTPTEVIDFIIHSVEDVLQQEFNTSLNAENTHILDPFTGTGSFITRLLQSGVINKENLERKYTKEIHANEIVLLPYYIAAVNIEMAYNRLTNQYKPFGNIVLTDTFNMEEDKQYELTGLTLEKNNEKIKQQKELPIQVIIGNPPYSAGQQSENDNNKNLEYKILDEAIANSYVKNALNAGNKNSLYDSYIRAFKWASNRLANRSGVVAFVTNGSYINSNAMEGVRKSFTEEFSKIYCFNLRGNIRSFGEQARKEGVGVFGNASMAGIAITILVKQANHQGKGQIYYHDIGDYLTREEKLAIIKEFKSIKAIPWQTITPNQKNDWLNQRNNPEYEKFITLGNKKDTAVKTIFNNYSCGVCTSRDAWAYNFSKELLEQNMANTIAIYNQELTRYNNQAPNLPLKELSKFIDNFVESNPKKISWSSSLKNYFKAKKRLIYNSNYIRTSHYRLFCKQYLYYNKYLNQRLFQIPKIFPTPNHSNLAIGTVGKGANKGFSAFIVNLTPDLELISKAQWFPLYTYEPTIDSSNLFNNNPTNNTEEENTTNYTKKDNISDDILSKYQNIYQDFTITKEDIFYYIYALLNCKEYITNYYEYLIKEIPKIPFVENFNDFAKAGKELAYLHLNYESLEPYPNLIVEKTPNDNNPEALYKVTKMKYLSKTDKSTIIYNNYIKIKNIPNNAYDYSVNGKTAIDWIIDRYQIKQDKNSGIINNPNLYSSDPEYILNLLLKVINLSVNSSNIINSLSPLKIIKFN